MARRIRIELPGELTARRSSASGRQGATRWEIYLGYVDDDRWLGDLVRFVPEWEYCWQPKDGPEQVFDSIEEAIAAIPLPDAP